MVMDSYEMGLFSGISFSTRSTSIKNKTFLHVLFKKGLFVCLYVTNNDCHTEAKLD